MNNQQGRIGADQFGNHDERAIDLLVDGELGDAERRSLLDRLDRAPAGWRRCALAFLEAQAWRQLMRESNHVAAAPASAGATDVACIPQEKGRRGWTPAAWPVPALAAAVLAAFAVGWLTHAATGRVDDLASTEQTRSTDEHVAGATPSPADSSPAESIAESEPSSPFQVIGFVTLTIEQDGTEKAVSVPIVDGSEIDEEWLLSQPVTIPEAILREVERQGHKLVANRQLVPIELGDGRRAVMPVDRVEVRLAGRVYQ